MKILVVEDKEMHRKSAEETLVGHEIYIAKSFDEAMDIMAVKIDEDNVQDMLTEAGFPEKPDGKDRAQWAAFCDARDEARKKSIIPFDFDVVLTDMMMLMSKRTLAQGVFQYGEQVPYGFVIALKAALRGAKFIAMVTDTNHHKSAMSAAIDNLGSAYYSEGCKPNFEINGTKVMFVHAPFVEDPALGVKCYNCVGGTACGYCRTPLTAEGKCPKCERAGRVPEPCFVCKGEGKHDTTVHERKDWGKVLKDLVGDVS